MNISEKIIIRLKELTKHQFITLTDRGNTAISAAISLISKNKKLLIPSEGGWIHYQKAPKKLKLQYEEVLCDDAKINLSDLQKKLKSGEFAAFLYQQPGGYFAEQPMQEIYEICKRERCLVIMDVSGAIGTELCNGNYANILVGSFGKEKLVNAGSGGFISCKEKFLFQRMTTPPFVEEEAFKIILKNLEALPERIHFLQEKRKKIIKDLKDFELVHPKDRGFVVVIKLKATKLKNIQLKSKTECEAELLIKEKLINYCKQNNLLWTECPRYIRLNTPAISIEVKRLEN